MKIIPDSAIQKNGVNYIKIENEIRLLVRILEKGWIDLPSESWIYRVTTSSHNNPEIGDVSVAIDNRKNLYIMKDMFAKVLSILKPYKSGN